MIKRYLTLSKTCNRYSQGKSDKPDKNIYKANVNLLC